MNKAGLLPSDRLCCPVVPQYYEPLGLPSCKLIISFFGLMDHFVTVSKKIRAGEDLPNSLYPLSYHADPLTPEDSSLPLQVRSSFRGLHPLSRGSASSCPSCEAFLTTRQDSLDVTTWYVTRLVSDMTFVDALLRKALAVRRHPSYMRAWPLP